MFEDQTFQHGLCGGAFVLVELLQGLELQAQAVVRAAFGVVKDQIIKGNAGIGVRSTS